MHARTAARSTEGEASPAHAASSSSTRTRCRCRSLTKIVVNIGLGEALTDAQRARQGRRRRRDDHRPEASHHAREEVDRQLPAARRQRPSASPVTLRGARMYEFLDRLVNAALPRIRDFQGARPNAFDGRGNYSLGIREQLIFPEIDYDKVDKVRGMQINDRHHRQERRRGPAAPRAHGHAVPEELGEHADGEEVADRKVQADAEVPGPAAQPLPHLRPPARRTSGCSRMCRICFRELALEGSLPGVTKSSW